MAAKDSVRQSIVRTKRLGEATIKELIYLYAFLPQACRIIESTRIDFRDPTTITAIMDIRRQYIAYSPQNRDAAATPKLHYIAYAPLSKAHIRYLNAMTLHGYLPLDGLMTTRFNIIFSGHWERDTLNLVWRAAEEGPMRREVQLPYPVTPIAERRRIVDGATLFSR